MLESYNSEFLRRHIVPGDRYVPYRDIDDRPWWDTHTRYSAPELVRSGEKWLGFTWPALPASRYLDFVRNGNRTKFEAAYFQRRNALWDLVVAECVEDSGRFLDAIVTGLWATCEETNWVFPAHNDTSRGMRELPKYDDFVIDLFSAETAAFVAYTAGMLAARLDKISPLIRERTTHELRVRIFDAYIARSDYWWMGFDISPDHVVNNWNPWINSNVISAALATPLEREALIPLLEKSIRSLDNYLAAQTDDGGCDEGPSYWSVAGGALFQGLDALYAATGGALDVYSNEKVRRIAAYIYKVHIHGDWYVNFADASAKAYPNPFLLASIADRIGDAEMAAFGHRAQRRYGADRDRIGRQWAPALWFISHEAPGGHDDPAAVSTSAPTAGWFEDIQVAIGRSTGDSGNGLFVAAKGGHNNESHNHNDIGEVIVYANGEPVLIDAGVGDYTRFTFSDQRYTIWTMQSAFHNLPTVNGAMQAPGADRRATGVAYHDDGTVMELALHLEAAYPDEAALESMQRRIVFDRRADRVSITDTFRLASVLTPMVWTFMTHAKPEAVGREILLAQGCQMETGPGISSLVERVELTDTRLKDVWGEAVYRIVFTETETRVSGERVFSISAVHRTL